MRDILMGTAAMPEDVQQALAAASEWAEYASRKSPSANAARVYLRAIPLAISEGDTGARVQVLYILSNLSGWKGEEAKQSKRVLKLYAGVR